MKSALGKGKTALGKGLGALIPEQGREVIEVELSRVVTGSEQPRRAFNDERLKELAASIKEKGVIQPVVVKREGGGRFMLIAGERRYRASQLVGLKKIPAIVREAEPEDALEIALIENLQREDLNPLETAHAFDKLIEKFGLSQEQVAAKVGKDRATVANYLRLLNLPEEIKRLLREGKLSMGHAKAILSMEGEERQLLAARDIVKSGLSVRASEKLSRTKAKKKSSTPPARDPDVVSLEQKLITHLGTKVAINSKGQKGSITIEYYSLEELERLLDVLLD
jgi:ParB family chromosome partitioning protein